MLYMMNVLSSTHKKTDTFLHSYWFWHSLYFHMMKCVTFHLSWGMSVCLYVKIGLCSILLFFIFFCMCNPICLTWWGDMFCIDLHRLRGWQQAWVQFKIWKIDRKKCVWYVCEKICVDSYMCVLIWFMLIVVHI